MSIFRPMPACKKGREMRVYFFTIDKIQPNTTRRTVYNDCTRATGNKIVSVNV